MERRDILTNYGHMFRAISCALGQRMNQALSGMELTFSQGHIMGYLAQCTQTPCVRDIEDAFQLTHPTVSGLLSRMEKKGFVRLEPDPGDRRRKLVYLLPKGLQCIETMSEVIRQGDATLLQGFTREEQEQFREYLARAMRNVSPDATIPKEELSK